jgi:Spondin_N
MKKSSFFKLIPAIVLALSSCKKEKQETNPYSEAAYSVEVTGKWAMPDFPVPVSAHFTNFVGMVHNEKGILWKPGMFATQGIENVAEAGTVTSILSEVDSAIYNKKALSLIIFTPPAPAGSKRIAISCNNKFSMVSMASMVAPSPDWFIGLSGFNLYKNNQWIADTTVQLYVYDAGTEDGDVFGYNNPGTNPQQPINLLDAAKATVLANGSNSLKPIATVRFTRL